MLRRFLLLKALPTHTDIGLLALRLMVAYPLFFKHGTEKLFRFQQMAAHFPDPLHIGAVPSLVFATISDGICSLLLALGLATRWAALIVFVNIFVAWAFVHRFVLFGPQGDHGELILLYLAACAMLFFAGAGRFSIDGLLAGDARPAAKGKPPVSVS